MSEEIKREFLRHTVATVAYRGAKAVSNVPNGFGDFKSSATTRTPLEMLTHIGDLSFMYLKVRCFRGDIDR